MVLDDRLANEFCPFNSALVNDNLVVFAELYLIVLYGLIECIILIATLLDVVDNL